MFAAAKPILAAVIAAGVGYAASPYAALYRLDYAVRTGDAATLQTLVDWPSVREGIKEDICDGLAGDPEQTIEHGKLPAFGASFMHGIAVNAVDRQVTPEALVDLSRHDNTTADESNTSIGVNWAFFDDPSAFDVVINVPGHQGPVRMQMTLQDLHWRVTRIWLTPHLLQQANART